MLLLEAGPKSHWLSPMPVSFAKLIDNPAANWCYRAEPDEGSGGRTIPIPRGRVLGGSSSINGLVFVRGQRLDYDTWAQLGNRGWSYDDILPLFRRMEHFESGADEWRAQGGPLRVSEVPDESPFYDALFRAGVEAGLPHNPDYNGEVDSVRWVRRIVGASAMDDFRDFEMKPGPEVESDDEIVEWIRATAQTAFHPVGTCKMGQDPMAVVDERLRVRGMESLRIADGSIMPTLVSGNTNAACIMIGEKASEMMLADAAA